MIGGLFSTEPVGREISMRLARHLIRSFDSSPGHIVQLFNTTVVHIYPQVHVSLLLTAVVPKITVLPLFSGSGCWTKLYVEINMCNVYCKQQFCRRAIIVRLMQSLLLLSSLVGRTERPICCVIFMSAAILPGFIKIKT